MEDAELVRVWVGQHLPEPAVFVEGLVGDEAGAGVEGALNFCLKIRGAQVNVYPVLGDLAVGYALQQDFDADPIDRDEA